MKNLTFNAITDTITYRVGDFIITQDVRDVNVIEILWIFTFTDKLIKGRIIYRNMINKITKRGVLTVYKDGTKHLKWDNI